MHSGRENRPKPMELSSTPPNKESGLPVAEHARGPLRGGGRDRARERLIAAFQGPDGSGAAPSTRERLVQQFRDRPSDASREEVHRAAAEGIGGDGARLPFADRIQSAFGEEHDLSSVRAHVGGEAERASDAMGAGAYTVGEHVAFGRSPDLRLAAHEAAHVVQQRRGLSLDGGVGERGDRFERHADAVADKVVRGESARSLLGDAGGGGASSSVQCGGGDVEKAIRAASRELFGKLAMRDTADSPEALARLAAQTHDWFEGALEEMKRAGRPLVRKLEAVRDAMEQLLLHFSEHERVQASPELHRSEDKYRESVEQTQKLYSKGQEISRKGRGTDNKVKQFFLRQQWKGVKKQHTESKERQDRRMVKFQDLSDEYEAPIRQMVQDSEPYQRLERALRSLRKACAAEGVPEFQEAYDRGLLSSIVSALRSEGLGDAPAREVGM